ncbi:antitoxin (DNA-binding transcriptional repressor) of toxin-antitoxin stability system [Sagittula marina]|uniref:Antitoxin (DNA-binding transcriptional repressor) of toxin-antitoxin stability system n=1 Tax=Sagittula marina TaxID=943940 RepID=A0A7W6DQ05_9RHOB|nr:hypothetical protein [Sagittula marina]MBB3987053.1 antitoxin (DNA-binding transcriptional repressor) of toxin-antitoxin stability system [Sagittula marina]
MIGNIKAMSITEFRATAAEQLRWVEESGEQIWLKRRGRVVSAVVPLYQLKVLDALLATSVEEKARGMQAEYKAHALAKKIQAREELARLERGLDCGGGLRTRMLRRQLEVGRDPWERDGVLVVV